MDFIADAGTHCFLGDGTIDRSRCVEFGVELNAPRSFVSDGLFMSGHNARKPFIRPKMHEVVPELPVHGDGAESLRDLDGECQTRARRDESLLDRASRIVDGRL